MDGIQDYFLSEDNRKIYTLNLQNQTKLPITFSDHSMEFNFNYFKSDRENELLKAEIECTDKLKIMEILAVEDSRNQKVLWVFRKENIQLIGISFDEFISNLKDKLGYSFFYPCYDQNFYVLLKGISGKPETYKLFIYFNNRGLVYADLIDSFKDLMRSYFQDISLNIIKKTRVSKERHFSLFNFVPKTQGILPYVFNKEIIPHFYFIENPNPKKGYLKGLSHIIVSCNSSDIHYNEKNNFSLDLNIVDLDEISICTLRVNKIIEKSEIIIF